MEGCCSIKWKNVLFHHPSTFHKTSAHSLRFSSGFGTSLIFTSFLLLRLTWNPRMETGVAVRRNVTRISSRSSLRIPRVSRLSLHIPHIFSRDRDYARANRFRLSSSDSLVSSRCSSVKEFARETNVTEKRNAIVPTCFVPLPQLPPFREASRVFTVSLLPAQRFPASDTAGLLILIIDRGIIKVALARGRFQLRISVSLGTIGPVGRRETESRERERKVDQIKGPKREIGDERSKRVLSLARHLRLSVLLILYLLSRKRKPRPKDVRGFS